MSLNFGRSLQFAVFAAVLAAPGVVQVGMAQVVVKTVPWIPSNPASPHTVISGVPATLAGSVSVGTSTDSFTYTWDFGDGSMATAANPVTNAYDLSVAHTYTAAAGTAYTAVLTVTDTTTPATYTANYPVIVQGNTLASRVNVAVDNGLWYLHQTMWRGTSSNNVPWGGWDQSLTGSGSCPSINGASNACLSSYAGIDPTNTQAFEVSGHLENGPATDPYTDDVARGLARSLYFLVPKRNNSDGAKVVNYNPAIKASRIQPAASLRSE